MQTSWDTAVKVTCPALQQSFQEIHDFVLADLIEGVREHTALALPENWKASLIEDPTKGSVEAMVLDETLKKQCVPIARSVLKAETILEQLNEIGTKATELKELRQQWGTALASGRVFTCAWSVWSLCITKVANVRSRQATEKAKRAKVQQQLKDVPLPAKLDAALTKWVKHNEAFKKAD